MGTVSPTLADPATPLAHKRAHMHARPLCTISPTLTYVPSTVPSIKNKSKQNASGSPSVNPISERFWSYGMKERDGKYTVDGLLRSVLKTVTVTVIVSQKGSWYFRYHTWIL